MSGRAAGVELRYCDSQSASPGGGVVRCELRYDHAGDHSGTFIAFGRSRWMGWARLRAGIRADGSTES